MFFLFYCNFVYNYNLSVERDVKVLSFSKKFWKFWKLWKFLNCQRKNTNHKKHNNHTDTKHPDTLHTTQTNRNHTQTLTTQATHKKQLIMRNHSNFTWFVGKSVEFLKDSYKKILVYVFVKKIQF